VRVTASKIAAIVRTDREDMPSAAYSGPRPTDLRVAEGVAERLAEELTGDEWGGRFALQLGAGPLAAALMEVLPFRAADIWTEGPQRGGRFPGLHPGSAARCRGDGVDRGGRPILADRPTPLESGHPATGRRRPRDRARARGPPGLVPAGASRARHRSVQPSSI